jgi:hypothetical protein
MRRLTASLAASALLAGCQSSLSPGQIAALEYGSPPEDYEKIVRDYLRPRLGEPNFALIEIKAGPSRLYQRETISREPQHGWAVCVMINDRDPRGGYTGFYPMVIYIRGGKVVATDGGSLERAAGLRYAHAQCGRLGYPVP